MKALSNLSKILRGAWMAIRNGSFAGAPSPAERDEGANVNAHLENYLDYYQTLEAPRFAVLVTGDWGTGKTYLVKKLLPPEGEGRKAFYVSLFGKNSSEEVMAAVYTEMHPTGEKVQKHLEKLGEATKGMSAYGFGLGGAGSFATNLIGASLSKKVDSSKVIVFDDLERSAIKPKTLLGVINHYVEHYGCRVVVIAHDEKLVKGINEGKEKIFGQTIRIVPDLESAYQAFLVEISDLAAKNYLSEYGARVKAIFRESDVKSLRILRQAMFDFARLFASLGDRHRENGKAMQEMASLFMAHDFEVRGGRFTEKELEGRYEKRLGRAMSKNREANVFDQAMARYPEINLTSLLLKDEVLVQTLIQGRYNHSVIRASLDDSTYFKSLDEMPNWRKVLEFDSLDDVTVETASEALELEFANRSITDFGALLHIFALRMMMAAHGIRSVSIAETEIECKSYIDDLLESRHLPHNFGDFIESTLGRAAYGFGFWVEENYADSFNRVKVHLREQSLVALERTFSVSARDLMETLSRDVREFIAAISYSGEGDHRFARLPVLKAIEPEDFVDRWMQSSKKNNSWLSIKSALESRYEGPALAAESTRASGWLNSEADWIKSVVAELHNHAADATGFKRYRIERIIPEIAFPEAVNPSSKNPAS
ncbi:MAG: P-loop NTPase fold protein [Methylocystis sp.]